MKKTKSKKKNIIVGVSGSIAAYKAVEIISLLKKNDLDVTVVMTAEAGHFMTPLTLQTISRNKVYSDMFEVLQDWAPVHISLAEAADLILICPATAALIGRLAGGICDDLLTCLVISSKAKVLICPAMNDNMLSHPVVAGNINKLKKIGYSFIGPVPGRLACGRVGPGHLAPVETIVQAVKRALK